MLNLNDSQWNSIRDAYGPASRIPTLLKELSQKTTPRVAIGDEPWETLWSSLCHQGDIYEASYAAVPHLIDIANKADWPIDFSFFALPALIEMARLQGRGPKLPDNLKDDYLKAIAQLPRCIARFIDEKWDRVFTTAACIALAASKGHADLADKLEQIDD